MFETCSNRKEKKLFGVRTKLTYYKVFHRKTVGYSNEKTSSTCEHSGPFSLINIES